MIDTHCHIDLYPNPKQLVNECERLGIITIGMTNLPSHFEMGYPHMSECKRVRLALGMHPLYANEHKDELPFFKRNLSKTSYIGEIGLDFSRDGIGTKEIQIDTFTTILSELKDKKKILSIHSRKAEIEVLNLLVQNQIKLAVFHWYSGPLALIDKIIEYGYYFSINPSMIKSKSGQEIIKKIPINRILTESDGPFIMLNERPIKPSDLGLVQKHLSTVFKIDEELVEEKVYNNFMSIIEKLK